MVLKKARIVETAHGFAAAVTINGGEVEKPLLWPERDLAVKNLTEWGYSIDH